MGPPLIVIGEMRGQNPSQMPRTEDKNVIEAVAPQRSNQPLNIWVLPWRPGRCWSISDPHRPNPALEDLPVGAVIVAHQIAIASTGIMPAAHARPRNGTTPRPAP